MSERNSNAVPDMTTTDTEIGSDAINIPAGLMPVDAVAARDNLREAIENAEGAVKLEVEEGPVSLCSLQMLISARKTVEAKGLDLTLGPNATERFTDIELT